MYLAGTRLVELDRASSYHAEHRFMRSLLLLLFALICTSPCLAESLWEIPFRDRDILIDGHINDWEGVPSLIIAPGMDEIRSGGEFAEGDLKVEIKALWDEEYIYLSITWTDNIFDLKEISRKDAVWVDDEGRRRDRMFFYDYLKFHIRKSDYDYTLWLSPRSNDQGPFMWYRLLEGYRGMERATGQPMVSAREQDQSSTLEVMLLWKELRLEGKKGVELPLTLLFADGDDPERLLQYKSERQKWLAWVGKIRMIE